MRTQTMMAAILAAGCGVDQPGGPAGTEVYRGHHAHTLLAGQNDNAEVIKLVPGGSLAVLLSSKARKLSLIRVEQGRLVPIRSRLLFADDPTESELTHLDVSSRGDWGAVSRTLMDTNAGGAVTACRGEVALVALDDSDRFGAVLARVPVGPMPDAVDISDDDRYVVSANERDVVWGKCEGAKAVAPPSLSIIAVDPPEQARELRRVMITGSLDREPEQVAIGRDNDLLLATLQDSHEVLLLRISLALAAVSPTSALGRIVALPASRIGQDAWPDGVARFDALDGSQHFAVAGEGNDVVYVVDEDATVHVGVELTAADFPADYPRDGSWGPLFRPDSVASFVWGGQSHLALSLKASGAVGVLRAGDPARVKLVSSIKIGHHEQSGPDHESSISPEGIAASRALIVTANEGESSASLVLPSP